MEGSVVSGALHCGYRVYGEGPEVILCFHGFGRKPEDFEVFLPLMKPGQRLVSIWLFGHGGSYFPNERIERDPLTHSEWRDLVEALLLDLGVEKVHVIGYSMGGRVAMMTFLLLPEKIESLLLLAPDGFKINRLYTFASGTIVGKMIYRFSIDHPRPLFILAKVLNSVKLLPDKLFRFVHVHLDTREKRLLVHDVWLIYKRMFPDKNLLAKELRERDIAFNMIFGEYDTIIRPELGERFSKRLNNHHCLHLIGIGHRLLEQRTAAFISERGLWP